MKKENKDLQTAETAGPQKTPASKASGPKNRAIQSEMLGRLKRIEGQVRGVYKMVEENRDCGDIVTQLTAIKAAVNRVSISVLACHLADQIQDDIRAGKEIDDSMEEFMAIFKKFS